jgi:hypothetical protein
MTSRAIHVQLLPEKILEKHPVFMFGKIAKPSCCENTRSNRQFPMKTNGMPQ